MSKKQQKILRLSKVVDYSVTYYGTTPEQLPRSLSSSPSFGHVPACPSPSISLYHIHPPPSPLRCHRLLLLSADTPHVAPERHQKHCVSQHFNHISSSHHVVLPSSFLCSLASRRGQWEPRLFTSASTSFPLFPPPISLLYVLFIRPLGSTFAGDGHLPTLWNKSSVSILADIVADDTHTYTHVHAHPGNFTAPCILVGLVLALRSKDSLTDCLLGQRLSLIQDSSFCRLRL